MYRILEILTDAEVAQCRKIAAATPFVDGRITNPHNTAKQNEQLHDASAYQQSGELLAGGHGEIDRNSSISPSRWPSRRR